MQHGVCADFQPQRPALHVNEKAVRQLLKIANGIFRNPLCGCYRNGGSEERERDKTVFMKKFYYITHGYAITLPTRDSADR